MGMSRRLRFIPDGGALVEVTCRTVQGRLLLCPSPQLNDIILGVLGRAQRKHPVEIVAYAFASNHWHALLRVMRIPTKPATYSDVKAATHSEAKAATLPDVAASRAHGGSKWPP